MNQKSNLEKAVINLLSTSIEKLPYYEDYELLILQKSECYINTFAKHFANCYGYSPSLITLVILRYLHENILYEERLKFNLLSNVTKEDFERYQSVVNHRI